MNAVESDLVVLVADRNMEYAMNGVLVRPESLAIRRLRFEVFAHPEHDPGCFLNSPGFLRPMIPVYRHCLVVFDYHGCGREQKLAVDEIEEKVRCRLANSGWGDRAGVVVIEPELESWVWSDSPHVDRCLGWEGRDPSLRTWLRENNYWTEDTLKPADPKAAVQAALQEMGKPRSSSIYHQLAQCVSLHRCTDPAFHRLKCLLQRWFPAQEKCK